MSEPNSPLISPVDWPWPGSRWWKFDFHTHTPASKEKATQPWQAAIGTPDEVTPEKWLLKYMAAGIDCLAITDHNSGAWIDLLKAAYSRLSQTGVAGFRPLTLFPGVEVSANSGVHVLAIFDPNAAKAGIDGLLATVGYHGTEGDSDAETTQSIQQVIQLILDAGAIPVLAHADGPKGLLRLEDATQKLAVSARTVQQALTVDGLLAMEWTGIQAQPHACVAAEAGRLARVLGSDCHNFQGTHTPGSRYTWVKMGTPTLEGLRLALLDGNATSLRRVEDGARDDFNPFRVPANVIRAIEVKDARVMGHGQPARAKCSPFFNAIVGGRGTGKSTLVHALRLATGRGDELPRSGEPRRQFDDFQSISTGREDKGALLAETEIHVTWQHDGDTFRLCWKGKAATVEEHQGGQWAGSASQVINAARFPVRILSQGQIAAMASGARGGLLAIVDEAGHVDRPKDAFDEARRAFLAQRARLRELDGQLAALPEVERKLTEVTRKLQALAKADHAQILTEYATSRRQLRVMKATFDQLSTEAARMAALPGELVLDDWPANHFDVSKDVDVLAWRQELDAKLNSVRGRLQAIANELTDLVKLEKADTRVQAWGARVKAAAAAHEALQKQLAAQGVGDPQAFERLTQERQVLEEQRKTLAERRRARTDLATQIAVQLALLQERRRAITAARQAFIQQAISANPHVRMSVVPMGFDAEVIERELRALLGAEDDRFADDILQVTDGAASGGLAWELASADVANRDTVLATVKDRLVQHGDQTGGHLRNYLGRQPPEFFDRVEAWFPEDDLRIEYQRQNKWHSIREGSQGQRSAALLAFLLAFGEEPIVLDQPEDDLDNHLIYELIVQQIRQNKLRRQLIVVTHNANVVVNGDAELVNVMEFGAGQCFIKQAGALQEKPVREEVCRVMEGGHEAFSRRWKRLGKEV
ncbi:MAG: chromosome segregation protein SMC [Rhodanobacteraceae bacterium]|nr:MAG: chromosome segregation protein SMC [Rhodanobacteraceae bacterium]